MVSTCRPIPKIPYQSILQTYSVVVDPVGGVTSVQMSYQTCMSENDCHLRLIQQPAADLLVAAWHMLCIGSYVSDTNPIPDYG
jgi:hypothetical protein